MQCRKSPDRLSGFWEQDVTREPELQPVTNTNAEEPLSHAAEIHTGKMVESTSNPATEHDQGTLPKADPERRVCPNLAAKAEEQLQTEPSLAWLETKEGQDHLRLCLPNCPYKLLLANLPAVTKGKEAKKDWIDTEEGQNHLKICVSNCVYRKTERGIFGGENGVTEPRQYATHISIVEGTPTEPYDAQPGAGLQQQTTEEDSKNGDQLTAV